MLGVGNHTAGGPVCRNNEAVLPEVSGVYVFRDQDRKVAEMSERLMTTENELRIMTGSHAGTERIHEISRDRASASGERKSNPNCAANPIRHAAADEPKPQGGPYGPPC